jgi:hypothetical protein
MFCRFAKSFTLTAGLLGVGQVTLPPTEVRAQDQPRSSPSISGFEIRDRNGASQGYRYYPSFSAAMRARESLMERMPNQRLGYPRSYNAAEIREYHRRMGNSLRQRKSALDSRWINLKRWCDALNLNIRRADAERAAIDRESARIRYLESRLVIPGRVWGERVNLPMDVGIRNASLRIEINEARSRLERRIADLRAVDSRLLMEKADFDRRLSEYRRDERTTQTQIAAFNQSVSSFTDALRAQPNPVRRR